MNERGFEVGRHRVVRLMRDLGLSGSIPKRFRRTTDSKHGLGFAPDLVQQDFNPTEPNRVWVSDITSDITYVWTDEGWAYLAVVLDLFSRRIVGWAIADHMRSVLVLDALGKALSTRATDDELVHHSDRGSQYASGNFKKALAASDIEWSMGATGCCYDNAVAESFFATLKKELITARPTATSTRREPASAPTSTCSTTHAAVIRRSATSAQPPSRRLMLNATPKLPWQRNDGVHFFRATPVGLPTLRL